ncbi:COQ9 family protein [Phenylobacterium sp.]|uniref:COQ9 family protein n=1 Tax=Phenylobacterium sp. TaxID=1871053 RepID=UPI00120F2052|nr:COQ9 family protein [Phenylobacterium sp.]THD66183.1 MAG: COQ9 family protein [Phenylobacterium sp.]
MARSASKPAPEAAKADWAETAEQQVLDAALKIVAHEGWTSRLAVMAGKSCGLSAGETELLLPHGAADLAALLSRRHDAAAMTALAKIDPKTLKIRERIARGVEARLNAADADEAAVRRLAGFLALPPNLTLGARLTWESADVLWRWAGDTATDENHYSKRALLAGILTGALAVRLSSGPAAALAFTDRRIENVMAFETWKRTTKFKPSKFLDEAAAAMGRIRYR